MKIKITDLLIESFFEPNMVKLQKKGSVQNTTVVVRWVMAKWNWGEEIINHLRTGIYSYCCVSMIVGGVLCCF